MGYVGNEPSVNFTSFAKQDITGNGGANYTLTHAVANANEIEVYVNNVRQEPTSAYSVSGTALTMTGNVASSDDFYVIYLGKALQTTVPPDSSVTNAKIANTTIDLTSKVTGVLPVANGGTGQTASAQNAQTFRLDHDVSGTANLQMFEDFEEADTDYTRVGSANWTVSSGAFSCATTGTYLCLYGISFTAASGGDEFDFNIEISTNSGGSFSVRSRTMCFVTGGQKSSVSNAFIFTVSDTSTFRLRMTAGNSNTIASGSTVLGSSTQHETGVTFVKLGVV